MVLHGIDDGHDEYGGEYDAEFDDKYDDEYDDGVSLLLCFSCYMLLLTVINDCYGNF